MEARAEELKKDTASWNGDLVWFRLFDVESLVPKMVPGTPA